MIIRRKPLGSEGIRKPRTLGLSLLREGIARVQSLSVQRQSTTDEPIDWGEGVPEDVYTDYDAANQVNQVDSSVVDQGDYETSFTDALGQAEQPVPRPANEARRTARRRVQRQPAEPPPPQVITPPPPPQPPVSSRPLRRQALSDGDTMPTDLKAMWELHKKLGHIREKPVVTRRPDGSPIPRKRAQIVEMPSKSSAEPELPRSASPIGAPLQREPDAPDSIGDLAVESPQASFAESDPMLPAPPEPAQLSAGSDTPEAFDAETTLTDFRPDSAADVRRSPIPFAPVPSAPAAPPVIDDSASVPPGAAREFAPSPQFEGGDPDDSDEEPETAPELIQRSASNSANAVRRAAIEAAIARVESPTAPDTPEAFAPDSFPEDAPNASDEGSPTAQTSETYQPQPSQPPTPPRASVQRTAQSDTSSTSAAPASFPPPGKPQADVPERSDDSVRRSVNSDFASPSASVDIPDAPQTEPGVQRNAVRRSAIDAAIARAEQPSEYAPDILDTAEVSPVEPFERNSARPAPIQRQIESNPPVPPKQSDSTAAQHSAQSSTAASSSVQRHADSTASSPDIFQNRAESVRRSAIESAAARTEQPAAPDLPESDAFFPDTPQATVTDRPGRTTTTSIQRQATSPAASESAVPEGESPQADFTDVPPISPEIPRTNAAAVRRTAIDAAIARAELPTAPDTPDAMDDTEAPAPAESGELTPPRQTPSRPAPVQRQSTPPIPAPPIQMPPSRESSGQPPTLQTPFAQAQPDQSAAESESFYEPYIRTATTDRIDPVRRAPNDPAIPYEEPPAFDDTVEFEPFSPDQPDSTNEYAPKPTAIQRHAEPSPTLPDQTDSIRRAAIQAAIVRAELPSAPDDVEDSFAEPAPFDSAESVDYADYADTDSAASPETPASPSHPTPVQRRAESPRSMEPSPDTTPQPTRADRTAPVRRATIDAAIARAEQPTETESSESFDSAAPDITSPPRPLRPRRTTVQRHAAPDTSAQPDQPEQVDLPTAFTPRPSVQRAADESLPEAPDTTTRRSETGRKATVDAAIARAEQPSPPDEFESESFAPDEPQPPTMPTSHPAVQRQATDLQVPTPPDRAESVRRAAIQAAIARAEQPTLPEADESEPTFAAEPYSEPSSTLTATGRRKSSASTVSPSAETQPAPTRRQTVQRHPGHSDSAPTTSPALEDDSIQRTPTVRRSAIDAVVARAEQPAAPPSFDFPETNADYLDVGDIYDVSTGDRADLPASSPTAGRSETRTADTVRRSAESDTPALNWPSTPRTPNRQARAERSADVSIQRMPETESAPEPSESQSQASADEVQMLRMLGLPPSTPITRSSPSTPPIVRSAAPEAVQRIPVTAEIVQREETASSNSQAANQVSSPQSTNDVQQAQSYSSADVEQVAQAVYQSLRNRLRIERERSRGRVQ